MSKNLSEKESEVRIVGKETQSDEKEEQRMRVWLKIRKKNREKMRGAKIRVL